MCVCVCVFFRRIILIYLIRDAISASASNTLQNPKIPNSNSCYIHIRIAWWSIILQALGNMTSP